MDTFELRELGDVLSMEELEIDGYYSNIEKAFDDGCLYCGKHNIYSSIYPHYTLAHQYNMKHELPFDAIAYWYTLQVDNEFDIINEANEIY
jgi:hypothetical protein